MTNIREACSAMRHWVKYARRAHCSFSLRVQRILGSMAHSGRKVGTRKSLACQATLPAKITLSARVNNRPRAVFCEATINLPKRANTIHNIANTMILF